MAAVVLPVVVVLVVVALVCVPAADPSRTAAEMPARTQAVPYRSQQRVSTSLVTPPRPWASATGVASCRISARYPASRQRVQLKARRVSTSFPGLGYSQISRDPLGTRRT